MSKISAPATESPTMAPRSMLRIPEAAEYLNVAPRTVRDYIAQGRLPAYRIAGQRAVRIKAEDVEALLQPIPAYTPAEGGGAA